LRQKGIYLSAFLILTLTLMPGSQTLDQKSAQEKKTTDTPQSEVTVTMKLIQVHVFDKNGKPVTHLDKSDFVLLDNGKAQTISAFERHFAALSEEKTENQVVTKEKLESRIVPEDEKKITSINRKFIFLFDLENNDLAEFSKAKKAALHFLETQALPSDEIGVLSIASMGGIILHEDLNSDHKKLAKVVRNLRRMPGRVKPHLGPITAETFALVVKEGHLKARMLIEDLSRFARALRIIPGIKNIVLFSSGFPVDMFVRDSNFWLLYKRMSQELAASNSPVYAINSDRPDAFNPKGCTPLGCNAQGSLKLLSDISGGKAYPEIGAINNFKNVVKEIHSHTSNYYVLGYYIDEKWDGRFHKIEVKVKGDGYSVYTQGGYFNPNPFSQFTEPEKLLHLYALALWEGHSFQVPLNFSMLTLTLPQESGRQVLLLSDIPLQRIREKMGPQVEMILLIFDEKNYVVESRREVLNLGQIPAENLYQYSIVLLPPGKYECRVVIRDLASGKGAVAASSVEVPEKVTPGPRLYAPLLFGPGKKSSYLNLLKEGEKTQDALSLTDIYPFNLGENSPLLDHLEQWVPTLMAALYCTSQDSLNPDLNFSAHIIVPASGQKIPLTCSVLSSKHQKDADVLLVKLDLPKLEPGKYGLEMRVEDASLGLSSQVHMNFNIESSLY
jgi:VWFA-related protein